MEKSLPGVARNANTTNSAVPAATQKFELSAEQFAALNQVKAQTVRARLCRTGTYFGVTPKKLLNGRLAWPAVQVEK